MHGPTIHPPPIHPLTKDPWRISRSDSPYHLAQLGSLCRRYPLDVKVVFVPTRQIGHNVGSALAASGQSWVNLHLTTPDDWAERLAGARLRGRGWSPLAQDADLFFVQSILDGIEWPAGHHLSDGFDPARMAGAVLRTLRALRSAGVDPHRVESASLRYGTVLSRLYLEYSEWMRTHRLYDRAALFSEATACAKPRRDVVFAVFDETPLQRSALVFVTAVSGGRIRRIGRRDYGAALPQLSAGRQLSDAPIIDEGMGNVHPAGLFAGEGLTPEDRPLVHTREAIGVEYEVRGVLRELLADDVPIDTVELVYTQEEPYLSLLVAVTDHLNLPMTSASGLPVTSTATGQSLLSFYRWAAAGFDPDELIRMCRSRLIERANLPPSEIGRVIDEFHKLHSLFKSTSEGSLRDVCRAGIEFLAGFAPVHRTLRDVKAGESLTDRLRELAERVEVRGKPQDLSNVLVDLVSDHKIEASVAMPGHLYVVPLARAGYTGRERTVVVGLAESSFPGTFTEDPFLLDDERRIVSQELALEGSRSGEPGRQLVRALGMSRGTVTLTSICRTVAEGRETYPSATFQQISEQSGGGERQIYRPVPEPHEGLDGPEIVLAVRHLPGVRQAIELERPWLAHGRQAKRERAAPGFGRFDGWLGRRAPELRPDAGKPVSVSALEDLASCPYRYFLKYVLGIRPLDETGAKPGHWLSQLEFGSLLHEILRELMEVVVERGERIDRDKHVPLMEEILTRKVAELRDLLPVVHEIGIRVDVSRLRRHLHTFINEETGRDAEPVGFEVSFGLGKSGGLNRPDPVLLELSDTVRLLLKGSIDRVDRGPDGYDVWDYKSGSARDFKEDDMLMQGRRLQWALYAQVLQRILEENGGDPAVSRSGYFFMSEREHGLRLADVPPPPEQIAVLLEPLFDLVEAGGLLHVQKSEACTYCDYNAVCAPERRVKDDLDAIQNSTDDPAFLDPLMRWMGSREKAEV